jgi:zinc transport system substrate-binding protein
MRRSFLAVLALVGLLVTGCGGTSSKVPAFAAGSGKLKVAASFYPLYEFARAVGGDKVEVVNLVPPGTEPHDWEPTAGHIKSLNQAQVFLYNGAGFEHWVEKTLQSLDNKALAAVETSHGFALIEGEAEEEDHDHDHGDASAMDPHIWLDPMGAIHTVEAIRDAFIAADGANKATYEANAAAYVAKLKALDTEFKSGLSQCRTKEFFTSHAAFGYLAQRYQLTQHPIMGLAPDAEPKPKELQAIVEEAKEHNVKYIFFETLVSDKVAKVIAGEVGAQTLVLNPFEGLTEQEIQAGRDYLSVMRDNLANLKTALECK